MLRKVLLSVAVVLWVSSVSFAGIEQAQTFGVDLQEAIELMHGHQNGDSFKSIVVTNTQNACAPCPTLGAQSQFACLMQSANAIGDCAVILVGTSLTAIGMQGQMIGECCEPKMQLQSLGLNGLQAIQKSDGPGEGHTMNQAILRQTHDGANACGGMSETSTVMALQLANLTGEACATGTVVSSMDVTTTQSQGVF